MGVWVCSPTKKKTKAEQETAQPTAARFNKEVCMENVAGDQDLALQQHFPYKTSKFSENSNCRINLLFHSRGLKLGHFGIFDALFPFLAFFKL